MKKTLLCVFLLIFICTNAYAVEVLSSYKSIGIQRVYFGENGYADIEIFSRWICDDDGDIITQYSSQNGDVVVLFEGQYVFVDLAQQNIYTVDGQKIIITSSSDGYGETLYEYTTIGGKKVDNYYIVDESGVTEIFYRVISDPSTWAIDQVSAAKYLDLVTPEMQGAYQSNTTRAEFCRMAIRFVEKYYGESITNVLASKGLTLTYPFTDTQDSAIAAAYALKITSGTSNTTFTPDGFITRQEAATMLTRTLTAIGMNTENAKASGFSDSSSFSSWAVNGINCMFERDIMSGVGNNTFSPKTPYTHEQAIVTFYRMYENVKK